MNISVFGLGYVGVVSAACLAREGNNVVGVEVNPVKVDIINDGRSPIIEKDIDKIISETVKKGRLFATSDAERAIKDTDISLICVGTPSNPNGSLKLDYVKRCAHSIGLGLRNKKEYHVVVLRSTVLPGTTEGVVIPELEYASGKRAGKDFGVVMNPEFLRESTSVADFYDPPVTVIGEFDRRSGDLVENLYDFLKAPVRRTPIKVAEIIKYANNAFHGLKVAFANEIGAVCKHLGIDSHQVMDIFCMDHKLNLSSYYLKPGFAFGGSCLPKDLRAINYKAKELDLEIPLLGSVLVSNEAHIRRAVDFIISTGKKKIGLMGLSFKAGTDDLRESPLVIIAETLIGKGYDLKIYDSNVSLARLFGANKAYIEQEIPHISSLLCETLDELITHAQVLIIGNKNKEFRTALSRVKDDTIVFDLVRIHPDPFCLTSKGYTGICW